MKKIIPFNYKSLIWTKDEQSTYIRSTLNRQGASYQKP